MSELHIPKLSQFIGLARNHAFARTNRFLVEFFPRTSTVDNVDNVIGMLCEEAEFPGKSIETRSLRIAALSEHRAHYVDYKNKQINFKFIIDNPWRVKKYFDAWMGLAVSPMSLNGNNPKEVGYYRDYIGTVNIFSLAPIVNAQWQNIDLGRPKVGSGHYSDPQGNTESPLYGVQLREAWPTEMSAQPMSSGSEGYHRLNITMTFKWWENILIDGDGTPYTEVQSGEGRMGGSTAEEVSLRLSEPEKIPVATIKSCKLPPKPVSWLGRFGGSGGFSGGGSSGSWGRP